MAAAYSRSSNEALTVFARLVVVGVAISAAGCGGSGPANPVAARSSAWVRQANALCLPRDRQIRRLELAAAPVFFSTAVVTKIGAEASELRRIGIFRRIPLLAYKWRIAAHSLRKHNDAVRVDQHLIAAHRVAEEYGIRCRLGAIPLSRIPGS